MTCNALIGPDGQLLGWACGSAWGMGVTTLHGEDADEVGDSSVYGYGHDGTDPHDFHPDRECNTEKEIATWETAAAECANPECPGRKSE